MVCKILLFFCLFRSLHRFQCNGSGSISFPFREKNHKTNYLYTFPAFFVNKGIILYKNEETPRIYRGFDEEYRKF